MSLTTTFLHIYIRKSLIYIYNNIQHTLPIIYTYTYTYTYINKKKKKNTYTIFKKYYLYTKNTKYNIYILYNIYNIYNIPIYIHS